MIHVIFVCLGNICRSPMAEAVFQRLVEEAGLSKMIAVDSAGTGSWHAGEPAHWGTRRILEKHGIQYHGRARQITASDMEDPQTYIITMDKSNFLELKRAFGSRQRLFRLLDFANGDERDVPDPYYSGNFEHVFRLVHDGCHGLFNFIKNEENLR